MRLLQLFSFLPLFISPVFSQGLQSRLNELGLDGFSQMLAVYNPALLQQINERNDITVWAPGNAFVAARLAAVRKRATTNGATTSAQITASAPPPDPPGQARRKRGPSYPGTNFETIITFLNDTDFVNLGPGVPARFTKNYATPLDGGSTSASTNEVVSGLGNTQSTLRGPFKFENGVIYEVTDFFTLPQLFTETFAQINISQGFYSAVVSSGKLSLFEETTAVTVFAPIDNSNAPGNYTNPEDYIITGIDSVYYSPNLMPGSTIVTKSGDIIKITWGPNGERLVNCRNLVRPNIPIKNGVVHFIDGPLFGPGACHGNSSTQPSGPPPAQTGTAVRQGSIASYTSAFAVAFSASVLVFY